MKRQYKALCLAAVFAAFVTLLALADRFLLCFAEREGTFFNDRMFVSTLVSRVGGIGSLVAAFVTQFFAVPILGIGIYSALLTLLVWLTARLLAKYAEGDSLLPLSPLPALMVCLMQFESIFEIQALVGFLVVVAVLLVAPSKNKAWTPVFDLVLAVVLYLGFGAVAAIYVAARALELITFMVKKSGGSAVASILSIVLMFVALPMTAWITLRAGLADSWARALTPAGYSELGGEVPFLSWMPWITIGVAVLAALILGSVKPTGKKVLIALSHGLQVAAVVACGVVCGKHLIVEPEEFFKKLDHWAYVGDWDEIISACKDRKKLNNTLYLNYLNLALAEKGQLIDKVFAFPTHTEEGLTVKPQRMSQTSAMLAEIYYACGQLAVAQRHAFEANCAMCDYSPRMLMILVKTNAAFGTDDVAEKYLRLLDRTLFYRGWVKDFKAGKGTRMNIDRKCAKVENELTGFYGDMWELGEVLKVCPENNIAVQYLIARTLINKDLDRFKYSMQTLTESGALQQPLPMNCQMAIVAYASNDNEELARYGIPESLVDEFVKFQMNRNRNQKTFWSYCFNQK